MPYRTDPVVEIHRAIRRLRGQGPRVASRPLHDQVGVAHERNSWRLCAEYSPLTAVPIYGRWVRRAPMEHYLLDALAPVNRQSHEFAPAERLRRETRDESANVAIMERSADPGTSMDSSVVDLRVGCEIRIAPPMPVHAVMQVEP